MILKEFVCFHHYFNQMYVLPYRMTDLILVAKGQSSRSLKV